MFHAIPAWDFRRSISSRSARRVIAWRLPAEGILMRRPASPLGYFPIFTSFACTSAASIQSALISFA